MERAWVVSIREQCRAAGIPFFFKQWGSVRKARAGRMLDGTTHDGAPPSPSAPVPHPDERRAGMGRNVRDVIGLPFPNLHLLSPIGGTGLAG
jgi:hypothetical protein